MKLLFEVAIAIQTDGIATSFTVNVADLCLSINRADFSPIDGVINAGALNGVAPSSIILNAKGTAITFTFPTAPGAGRNVLGFAAFRNV